jgi:hypothetical protein
MDSRERQAPGGVAAGAGAWLPAPKLLSSAPEVIHNIIRGTINDYGDIGTSLSDIHTEEHTH